MSGVLWRAGPCDAIIEQDKKANTIVMWLEVDPHVAALARVGSYVRAVTEKGVQHRWRVVKIDEPAGRLYVVPRVEM